jgi:hypothetical protein
MRSSLAFAVPCLAALQAFAVSAAVYDVGPGQPLASIGAAPWATLAPGDVVRIHWRAEPYREKWVIGRSGTSGAPIVVQGVLGPGGERPVVSGDGATTPSPLNFWSETRGLIKLGGSNVPDSLVVSDVVIENLELRSAHPSYSFSDDAGLAQSYAANAAAIFVEAAQRVVIRNCVLTDSGNGLFVAAADGETQDIRVERNWIAGNGNDGSIYEHNTYTSARGIVYDGNRFGPLRAGALGNNLKDRSAGLVVRYNWIEGGNRQLDLVDGEDSSAIVEDPRYGETFVYGNVLIEPDGAGNRQIVHYGGDSGAEEIYRKGVLHFFHNTVISTRVGRTTLLRLSSNDESADVRNNVIWTQDAGNQLELLSEFGALALSRNWIKPGWVDAFGGLAGTIDDDGTSIETSDPFFADAAAQDFRLLAASDAVDAAGALHPDVLPDHAPTRQYLEHQTTEARVTIGAAADLGAFESCFVACPEPGAGIACAALFTLATLGLRRG